MLTDRARCYAMGSPLAGRCPKGVAELAAMPWPHLAAPRAVAMGAGPVGLDEDGQLVTVSLIERNVLIAGEPGGGKSVGQSMLTATAALAPGCELTLLNGKYVELASWVGCAARTVGPNQDECIDVLRALVKEMTTATSCWSPTANARSTRATAGSST